MPPESLFTTMLTRLWYCSGSQEQLTCASKIEPYTFPLTSKVNSCQRNLDKLFLVLVSHVNNESNIQESCLEWQIIVRGSVIGSWCEDSHCHPKYTARIVLYIDVSQDLSRHRLNIGRKWRIKWRRCHNKKMEE